MTVAPELGGHVINPRSEAVLIRDRDTNQFEDETRNVSWYEIQTEGRRIGIAFKNKNKVFSYGSDRVQILHSPTQHTLMEGDKVEVQGTTWENATEVLTFTGADGAWSRVFYGTQAGEAYRAYPASQVRVITSAAETPAVASVLRYWRTIVSRLPHDDPLRPAYDRLGFIHPESVLNSFLAGTLIESNPMDIAPTFPFHCNLSQRRAVENALTYSVSIIEGPPGTGKTETILNLIANITAVQHKTVGIVSFGNAAVDNVHDKLDKLGFGHVIGNLGRKQKREEFLRDRRSATIRSRSSLPTLRTRQIPVSWRTWTGACVSCRRPSASAPAGVRRSTPTDWSCGTLKNTCSWTSYPSWGVFPCCAARPTGSSTI
jgi:hypothetical protein